MISLVRVYYVKKEIEKGLTVKANEQYSAPHGEGYQRMINSVPINKKILKKMVGSRLSQDSKASAEERKELND
jgi:hypothetical protein